MTSILDRFERSDKADQIDDRRRGLEPITRDRIEDEEVLNKARKGEIDTTRYSDTVRR